MGIILPEYHRNRNSKNGWLGLQSVIKADFYIFCCHGLRIVLIYKKRPHIMCGPFQ